MAVIRNKLNQKIPINLIGGKGVDLLAKGTADLSEEELSSPHLQALITRGDILAVQTSQIEEKGGDIKAEDIKKRAEKKQHLKKRVKK